MNLLERVTAFCFDRPGRVITAAVLLTLLAALAATRIHIDTDPENMLPADQPDRVVYREVKRDFGLHDMIVVGIVREDGVFRPDALERVARSIEAIRRIPGVMTEDVVSLTTTDIARAAGDYVAIGPVMAKAPASPAAAQALHAEIRGIRFLDEKVASADGRGIAVYVPIRAKDQSFRVARAIRTVLDRELGPGTTYHVAGLPIAEDTFGHEMFLQMAVVAPLAFLGILVLVHLLFGEPSFLFPVGAVAMLSVVWTMGALIGTGHTVHIMSSMIPVFLMPIAILDSVHLLSEYAARVRGGADPRQAMQDSMRVLFRPMLFTSLTTAAGFSSLASAGIPPVQVFGLFVALGVAFAWILTHTLLVSLIALSARRLAGRRGAETSERSRLEGPLRAIARFSYRRAGLVVALALLATVVAAAGIRRLQIDDNPVRWFRSGHPMRISDSVMNRLFGGTYMANLIVSGDRREAMHDPRVVAYVDRLQRTLESDPSVGKTSSVADLVKQVNRVLNEDRPEAAVIPATAEEVGQMLFIFQGSGNPRGLDNFIDHEARKTNIWVQMRSGDNRAMARVERAVADFARGEPPPAGVRLQWSGLNHINRVWQEIMVTGMLVSVLGSFASVFVLLILEFRSLALALLGIVPLTVEILFSYGAVGLIGKTYDMPIAVCSSLALGLSADFAIHYLERSRAHFRTSRDLRATIEYMAGPPGRAIARNAIVISIGFLPLAVSSLTPYVTVSLFFAALMIAGAVATLILLPALLRLAGGRVLA